MAGLSHGRRRLLLLRRIGRRLGARRLSEGQEKRSSLVQVVVFVRIAAFLLRAPSGVCVFWGGVFLVLSPVATQAQPIRPAADSLDAPLIVAEVRFVGNDLFADEMLRTRIRTAPNRRLLGIPGFTWWLWFYRLGASGTFGKRFGQALMDGGEPPAYLDTPVVEADIERLRLYYQQEGFRQAQVTARIDTAGRGTRAKVLFEIASGRPTYIRRVVYDGLDGLDAGQQLRLADRSAQRSLQCCSKASRPADRFLRHVDTHR